MIPHRLIAYGLAVLAIFLGGMGAGSALRNLDAKADLAKCQKTNAETIATLLRAAQEAEESYRKREAQINALQTEALDAALSQAKQAQDDASRVRALLDRMRKQATSSSSSQPPANSPSVSASEATGTPGSVQADMLIGLGETAAILAEYADKARIAGMKCQADYEALVVARLW